MKSKNNKQAIVFLNGEVDHVFSRDYIATHLSDLEIYCADGAWNQLAGDTYFAEKVTAVIGDGDSIVEHREIAFIQLADQDTTDFEKVLNILYQKGIEKIYVFGGGGGEMDHYLSNLSVMLRYQDRFEFRMIDRYGCSFFIPKQWQAKVKIGAMVSVVPFPYATRIFYQGLMYPLMGEDLGIATRTGVRNCAVAEDISIEYNDGQLLVFVAHDSN